MAVNLEETKDRDFWTDLNGCKLDIHLDEFWSLSDVFRLIKRVSLDQLILEPSAVRVGDRD